MIRPVSAFLAVFILFANCAPKVWIRLDGGYVTGPGNGYRAILPAGWVQAAYMNNRIYITRDGPDIQFILIEKIPHKKAFKKIEKESSEKMLPSELAELTIAEIKSTSDMQNITVLKNSPATIGGKQGFRLHISFSNAKGLGFESVYYGFVDKDSFYIMLYRAPSIHYFGRDLKEFEKVVQSFTVLDSKYK